MMQTRTSGKENQMTEQEGKAMMGEDEDVRGAQRSRGRWLIAFKFKCKGRHARLITPLSWWDVKIMWEFPSCRCWTWYWMNKLAVSLVNKACWPKFPVGAFHCVVCGAFFFFKVVFGWNTRYTMLFHWRGTGMHTGMPLRVFVDTHDHGPQMLTKAFCWGSRGSLPRRHLGSCEAVAQDIATF